MLGLRPLALEFMEWEGEIGRWRIPGEKYKTTAVWREIRSRRDKVEWHRLLWGSYTVPKYSFIAWMAVLDRLPTKDRMQKWGIMVDGQCVLCKQENETRNHLFFGCSFSQSVWKRILQLNGLGREVMRWEEELKWVYRKLKGKSLITLIMRCAWSAFIYAIWKERNRRMYADMEETHMQVLDHIKQRIKIKFAGLENIEADQTNLNLVRNWGLSPENFCFLF